MSLDRFFYCPKCGSQLTDSLQLGRVRETCPACGYVHFEDPKVAVAVLVIKDGAILMARRANEPGQGFWTLPAGFVDAGEDPARAAERECLEETGLTVKVTGLFDLLTGREHARGSDILLVYRAETVSGTLNAGDDADGAGLFQLDDLPPLAFESTRQILQKLA
jgi:ADP-ribose pyrophosphatase YjhB (NUDIX family)